MKPDNDLERQLRDLLRQTLDREIGPDPTWDESPAAQRVAKGGRRARVRWPLRILAVAAVIGVIGGGAAVLLGAPDGLPGPSGVPANGWIAFTVTDDPADRGSDEDIWLVALDQEPRRVIGTDTDAIDELCPAFSPDGRRLAYGRVEGSAATLGIVDVAADGHISAPITIGIGDGQPPPCPVWSPDGDRIAVAVNRTSPVNPQTSARGSEVWVVSMPNRQITTLPDLLATDLEFSPDGSQLAIASGVDQLVSGNVLHDGRIHLFALETGTRRSLDASLGATALTWAPDSRRIAYEAVPADNDSEAELRVVDIATEEHDVLASYSRMHGIGPAWSPHGEAIVYQRLIGSGERHEVVLVSATDGSEVVIRASVESTDGTSLSLFPFWVVWSPDGQYLLDLAWAMADNVFLEPLLTAVPLDPGMPTLLLSDLAGVVAYDGYDGSTFVPIQTWGREPD
jgi:Tol biopolymer transport system component